MHTVSSIHSSAISCPSHTLDVARKIVVSRSHGLRREEGHSFWVIVDAYSKWPEINLMKSTTASATIGVAREPCARFGLPEQVVTGNRLQFASAEVAQFLRVNGVKHIRVAAHHQANNGVAEGLVHANILEQFAGIR